MNIHLSLGPLIALIAGSLILVMPKLLNFIVALYRILVGLIGIFVGPVVLAIVYTLLGAWIAAAPHPPAEAADRLDFV